MLKKTKNNTFVKNILFQLKWVIYNHNVHVARKINNYVQYVDQCIVMYMIQCMIYFCNNVIESNNKNLCCVPGCDKISTNQYSSQTFCHSHSNHLQRCSFMSC